MNLKKEDITKLLKLYHKINPELNINILTNKDTIEYKQVIYFLNELQSIEFFEIFSDLRETSVSSLYQASSFLFTPYEYKLICSLTAVKQQYEILLMQSKKSEVIFHQKVMQKKQQQMV